MSVSINAVCVRRSACRLVGAVALTLFAAKTDAETPVNIRDFGGRGDAVHDDTAALRDALAASRHVILPSGVYRITDGIDLPPGARLIGDGAPNLGVFPLKGDDKRLLKAGAKNALPGTTLLFCDRGEQSQQTGRADEFAAVRYGLRTDPDNGFSIEKLGIVLDVNVVGDDGRFTVPADDQSASYDVGLLIDDSAAGTVRDVCIFGYWEKAGTAIVSRGLGDNPDYNTFWNCSLMGRCGVALLGSDQANGPGLSGTQFHGCRIFAGDHHHRPAAGNSRAAVYIDGKTAGKKADLNGHSFFGGCIRTYHNTAVELNRASNVSFHGVVFEVPPYSGSNRANRDQNGKIVGTDQTRNVFLYGCRMHDIGLAALGEAMPDGGVLALPDHRGKPTFYDRNGRTTLTGGP